MINQLRKGVIGSMIALASMTGCKETRKVKTLNSYMANKPAKEYIAIKSAWREGLAKDADKQRSLDSVAFSRLLATTRIANDSKKVKEFNKIAQKNRLKNDSSYKVAYKEMDNKMLDNGILTKDYISSQAEYKQKVKYVPDGFYKSKEILDDKEVLKLRQFKLDSLEYGKFFEKNSPETLKEFKQTANEVKP